MKFYNYFFFLNLPKNFKFFLIKYFIPFNQLILFMVFMIRVNFIFLNQLIFKILKIFKAKLKIFKNFNFYLMILKILVLDHFYLNPFLNVDFILSFIYFF